MSEKVEEKVYLLVSVHHYEHLPLTITDDYVPISMYLEECSRDQLIIQRLIERNTDLRKELEERNANEKLIHPSFLQQLIEQSVKNHQGKKLEYAEQMKKIALYIFMLTGPLAYQLLQKNLPLPSISTVRLQLGKETPTQEGAFQVELIKQEMTANHEPMFVWVAEDDTKITSRLRYNVHDDTIMGLELPMDQNGVPTQSFLKFTSIKAVVDYMEKYPVSSYAKLLTCRSLDVLSTPFQLIIYGTRGSDKAEGVILRWEYVFQLLLGVGIQVMGFSSDGFTAFLKAMQHVSGIPTMSSDCPPLFKWCFFGKWRPHFLSIQDATHMVVKAHRALMTKNLIFGKGIASKSILIALTKKVPKMIIGISEHMLTEDKDAMNFGIAEKVCSTRVTDRLKRPEELATRCYLQLMRHIITAYIDPSTSVSDRFFSAWYLVFFCRIWKEYLKQDDTSDSSVTNNFISPNLHACIEINGHNLLLFHNKCRELNKPELFLPSLTGSQPCEDKFRGYRSMTTTKSTVINFDILELCQKAKRMRLLDTIASNTENFTFKKKQQKEFFIPDKLLTDDEVNNVLTRAFAEAGELLSKFSKFLSYLIPRREFIFKLFQSAT